MGLFQLLGGSLTCGSSFRNRTLRLRSTLGSRNYRSWLRRFLRGWSSGPWAGPCSSDGLSSFPPTKSLKVRSWKVKKNGSSMFGERDRGWWMLKKRLTILGFSSEGVAKCHSALDLAKWWTWMASANLGCGVMFQDNAVVSKVVVRCVVRPELLPGIVQHTPNVLL